MVLKKNKTDSKTLFIDASNEYIKVTNNNRLSPENTEKIMNAYASRADVEHFSYLASYEEIENHGFDLAVSNYVEAEDDSEDLDISEIKMEIEKTVEAQREYRAAIDEIIKEIEVTNYKQSSIN